eukprot:3789114-Prymnesium_polylepis.1
MPHARSFVHDGAVRVPLVERCDELGYCARELFRVVEVERIWRVGGGEHLSEMLDSPLPLVHAQLVVLTLH